MKKFEKNIDLKINELNLAVLIKNINECIREFCKINLSNI
jgi:hypothetical protein